MSTLTNGAKMLLECLAREGVDCFFGYPGGVTLPFYDAIYDHHIRHVLVRHEENACFAAEGYARATGKVGVCCATSGPGATNLVTGLVDAMMDSIPIVALTGQVTSKLIGSDAFQEADTFGITRSCTKHNYLVKKLDDLPQVVHEAFYIAASGRPGPVLVDIPKDVFQAQGHYTPVTSIHLPGYKVFTEGHTGQIRRAAQIDPGGRAAVHLCGRRHHRGQRSAELREFAELLDAPVVTTLMGLGATAVQPSQFRQHARHARQLRRQHGHDSLRCADCPRRALRRSRHRPSGRLRAARQGDPRGYRSRRNRQEPRRRRPHRGRRQARPRHAQQAGRRTSGLSATGVPPPHAWWSPDPRLESRASLYRSVTSDTEIKPQHLMTEIDRLSGGEAIVCSDVGQHQMWAAQLIRFNEPRLWINSGGLGAMGFGLPSAIGAQFARPDKLVFALVGDGGFQMSIPELSTIASHGLPIKIIVMNNGYLGMVRQWQELFYNNRLSSVELDCFPDAEKLAGAYGFKGRTIDKPWELASALEEAVREPGPYLLNVKVSPYENVYPMVPAGGAINEMVLGPPQPVAVPK